MVSATVAVILSHYMDVVKMLTQFVRGGVAKVAYVTYIGIPLPRSVHLRHDGVRIKSGCLLDR